jgi:hypothetical protein
VTVGTDAFKRQSCGTSISVLLCIHMNTVSVVDIACNSAI